MKNPKDLKVGDIVYTVWMKDTPKLLEFKITAVSTDMFGQDSYYVLSIDPEWNVKIQKLLWLCGRNHYSTPEEAILGAIEDQEEDIKAHEDQILREFQVIDHLKLKISNQRDSISKLVNILPL
jgi:hypothetical protein